MTALEKRIITYNTILSINDPSNDFIPYWNLAMKENLNNNFITIDSDSKKSGTIPLTSFNFKLIDIKEKSNQENVETIQLIDNEIELQKKLIIQNRNLKEAIIQKTQGGE